MWKQSQLSKTLGIEFPIIQAPMAGGATTPELIAAVSNAGGLGSLGAGYLPPQILQQTIREIRAKTAKPFAVNLFIPEKYHTDLTQQQKICDRINKIAGELNVNAEPLNPPFAPDFDAQMEVIIQEKVPVFSFTFGIPSINWLKALKVKQIITLGTATSLVEAKELQTNGIDFIVAQSVEAGGHRGSFIEDALLGNRALIPHLVSQIRTPIIAAGGIMNARGILAALLLGADSVQMGTAFLTCPESGIHPAYKKILLIQNEDRTVLTKAFSGKWARGINNKFIREMGNEVLDYPVQNALTGSMRKLAAKHDATDFMALWSGQAAFLSRGISAHELIKELSSEVEYLIRK